MVVIRKKIEILKLIGNLSSYVSLPYSIPVNVLKNHVHFFKNFSFQQGFFPNYLKGARVTPIFKRGDPQLLCNYHTISIVSVFRNVLKNICIKVYIPFLTKYNNFLKDSFDFKATTQLTMH